MEKVKDKRIDTVADLTVAAVMAPVGFAVGNLRSLVDPFALMHEIKFIENKGIQSLADYSVHLFGAVGYGVGIHTLYTLISKSPENPWNYIPLATNVIGAGVQIGFWAYEKGKKKGLELTKNQGEK